MDCIYLNTHTHTHIYIYQPRLLDWFLFFKFTVAKHVSFGKIHYQECCGKEFVEFPTWEFNRKHFENHCFGIMFPRDTELSRFIHIIIERRRYRERVPFRLNNEAECIVSFYTGSSLCTAQITQKNPLYFNFTFLQCD